MDTVKEGIRLNLIELLERTGKKRTDLAKACGVGRSAVTNWVNGDSSIDIERIPSICKFFDVTIDEFFGRSEELEPAPDLSPDERELVDLYRATADFGRGAVMSLARQYSEHMPRSADDGKSLVITADMTDEEVNEAVRRYREANGTD